MRVISGKYKGRKLEGFNIEGTRPTMDRVKESLFGSIQNYIKDSVVLDLFAGSGSLGIEALSNGALACYFCDNNNEVIDILKKNLQNIDNSYTIKSDYMKALYDLKEKKIKFDIIFLDPPYKLNLINDSIKRILEYSLLNKDGILVCEYETENIDCDLKLLKEKRYGTTYVKIYKNINK